VDGLGNLAQQIATRASTSGFVAGNASFIDGTYTFYSNGSLFYVQWKVAPPANNLVFVFPGADGIAGSVLTTDGIGNLTLAGYTPAVPGNWLPAPPATFAAALDRLAAWMTGNFPLLPPP